MEFDDCFNCGLVLTGEYKKDELLEAARSGNEEKLMSLLTPLNVNCHASDGRKVCVCVVRQNIQCHIFVRFRCRNTLNYN